jgi:drug/metabolite transporter (DMT)-like permease
MKRQSLSHRSTAMVALAAFLWATDALFRHPVAQRLDPALIVFSEHVLIVMFMLPWVLLYRGRKLLALTRRQWIGVAVTGVGASALATVLFTESFRWVNPSVSILLQKIQPVLVVVLAYYALGERPRARFYPLALVALAAGLVLSFPDFDFGFLRSARGRGTFLALSAACLWAIATVTGRALLMKLDFVVVSFWRFVFALLALGAWLAIMRIGVPPVLFATPGLPLSLVYMALIPGLLAMLLYYGGLAGTPASIATFVELIFPLSAVVLNTLFLGTPLGPVQSAAAAVLLIAVTWLG